MPRRTSKVTNWAAKFDELERQQVIAPPAGFFTIQQWEKKLKLRQAQTRLLLRQAYEAGQMERPMFRVQFPWGSKYIPHYRLIKAPR
jgi:hypothetical protein